MTPRRQSRSQVAADCARAAASTLSRAVIAMTSARLIQVLRRREYRSGSGIRGSGLGVRGSLLLRIFFRPHHALIARRHVAKPFVDELLQAFPLIGLGRVQVALR